MGMCWRLRAAALQAELKPITHLQFSSTTSNPKRPKDAAKFVELINLVGPFVKSIIIDNEEDTSMPDFALTAEMPNLHSLSLKDAPGLLNQIAAVSPNVRYLEVAEDARVSESTLNWILQLPLVKLDLQSLGLYADAVADGVFTSTTMQAAKFENCTVSADAILSILRSSRRCMESLSLRDVEIVGAEEEYDDDGGDGCSFVEWRYVAKMSAGFLRRICTRSLTHLHIVDLEMFDFRNHATSLFENAQFSLRRLALLCPSAKIVEAILPTVVERNPGLEVLCLHTDDFFPASAVSPLRELVHLVALCVQLRSPEDATAVLALIRSSSLRDLAFLQLQCYSNMKPDPTLRQACFDFRAGMPHVSVSVNYVFRYRTCSHHNFEVRDDSQLCAECDAAAEPYRCCLDFE